MLQNGVIMDVTNREQAEIAQKVFYFHQKKLESY